MSFKEQHQKHLELARLLAEVSPDDVKVGCVILLPNGAITTGVNVLPLGFDPQVDTHALHGEFRNEYISHAEEEAVFSRKGEVSDFYGATVYLTHPPCPRCARMLTSMCRAETIYVCSKGYNEFASKEKHKVRIAITKEILEKRGITKMVILDEVTYEQIH